MRHGSEQDLNTRRDHLWSMDCQRGEQCLCFSHSLWSSVTGFREKQAYFSIPLEIPVLKTHWHQFILGQGPLLEKLLNLDLLGPHNILFLQTTHPGFPNPVTLDLIADESRGNTQTSCTYHITEDQVGPKQGTPALCNITLGVKWKQWKLHMICIKALI